MGLQHNQDASNNSSGLQLVLGLSLNTGSPEETITSTTITPSPSNKVIDHDEPSLTLGLSGGGNINNNNNNYNYIQQQQQQQHDVVKVQVPRSKVENNYKVYSEEALLDLSAQTSPHSVVSSFSSGRVVKRERDLSSEEVEATEMTERVSSRVISDEDEDGTTTAARKKLRLTKDQSALLEDSFKQHSTLNPKQKQALARQLNLRPRQVEVWFQNRRARTKLKQTEVDCEFLKKCCETLTDENRRLQKELQELKALKLAQPLYMPMPAATLTMCPSCERLGAGVSGSSSNKSPFSSLGPKSHHFYNPFTNPSAAC